MRDDLIVIPLFSRGALGPTRVVVRQGEGGIANDSIAFCEEITTIDRDSLSDGPLGQRLPAQRMEVVVRAIRRALGETLPGS